MKCLIIDDDKASCKILTNLISQTPSLTLAGCYTDTLKAHSVILQEEIDLIFLDIEMPKINGLQLAKILEEDRPLIIFTTSQKDYAVEAFDLNAVDYLIKPLDLKRFIKAVEKAQIINENQNRPTANEGSNFVFIKEARTIRKINPNEILYIKARSVYVNIYMSFEQMYTSRSSLALIEEKLPKSLFLRTHRSFIVNLSKIDVIEGKNLVINGTIIPVAEVYRNALFERMIIL